MDSMDFAELLDHFAANCRWQEAIPCPCTLDTGAADRTCLVCLGMGRTWGPLSDPFQAPLLSQDARSRAALAQTMGPGMLGSCTLLLPFTAPCYDSIREGDRVWDTNKSDQHRMVIQPGTVMALPLGYSLLSALVKAPDGQSLVRAVPPVPDASRRISVTVLTTVSFMAPRGYEVVRDLTRVRGWSYGLPKRITLSLIDMTAR